MSVRLTAAVLFAVAFVTVPFPLFGLSGSLVPAARFVQLASVLAALLLREGAGGMVGAIAGLMIAHALVYSTLLALACWALARLVLSRLPGSARAALVAIAAVTLIGVASVARLYDTQFHHTSQHARLWELYR